MPANFPTIVIGEDVAAGLRVIATPEDTVCIMDGDIVRLEVTWETWKTLITPIYREL